MTLDAVVRPIAADMISKFGAAVRWTGDREVTYVAGSGTTLVRENEKWVKAIIEERSGARPRDGDTVAVDKYLTIAATSFDSPPKLKDRFDVGGVRYTVETMHTVYGGALAAIYQIGVKR